MGRAAAFVTACILAPLAVTACGSAHPAADPSRPAAIPSKSVAAVPRCAWYTPTIVNGEADGQQVIVAISGPGCRSLALIRWISLKSQGNPWAATTHVSGTAIAQLAKGGTVIKIYQTGFAAQTQETAGCLADDLAAAGWTVQAAPPGGPTPSGIASQSAEE